MGYKNDTVSVLHFSPPKKVQPCASKVKVVLIYRDKL